MFSFVKTLDICNENISFTIYGNSNLDYDIKNYLQKKFITRATFKYIWKMRKMNQKLLYVKIKLAQTN